MHVICHRLDLAEKPVQFWSPEEVSAHVAALWEQVAEVRASTCRTLVTKYSSILSSDDRTHTLGEDVMVSFTNIRPLFDQMHQVGCQGLKFIHRSNSTTG